MYPAQHVLDSEGESRSRIATRLDGPMDRSTSVATARSRAPHRSSEYRPCRPAHVCSRPQAPGGEALSQAPTPDRQSEESSGTCSSTVRAPPTTEER